MIGTHISQLICRKHFLAQRHADLDNFAASSEAWFLSFHQVAHWTALLLDSQVCLRLVREQKITLSLVTPIVVSIKNRENRGEKSSCLSELTKAIAFSSATQIPTAHRASERIPEPGQVSSCGRKMRVQNQICTQYLEPSVGEEPCHHPNCQDLPPLQRRFGNVFMTYEPLYVTIAELTARLQRHNTKDSPRQRFLSHSQHGSLAS